MARQRLGQHFLTSTRILERIAAAACPEREPLVVEIGPGTGALTLLLLERARRVVVVELDERLAAALRAKYGSRLTVISGDALDVDLGRWGSAVITGNLPYYAATAIIERVVTLGSRMRRGVFLIQKEVARRLCAQPGSRDYGYLTTTVRLFADAERLFDVRPSAFRPPPKVDSTVVRLDPHPRSDELGIGDPQRFRRFLAACFRHKRKTIRNNLAAVYGKDAAGALPEASLRAEQLGLEQFAEMYRRLVP